MTDILHHLVDFLVGTIGKMGYPGVVGLMFLESSFFPFPSEVVVPPAGYLASLGRMNLWAVIASGILGSLLGAWFNYWVAVRFGRPFFERYGRYFGVTPSALDKAERFFARHGHVSTFTGRLLPVIRQYISLPAGVSRMSLWSFSFYTALGSGIWVVVLALAGYWFGSNQEMVHRAVGRASFGLIAFVALLVAVYVALSIKKGKKEAS
ncbi:MAG: DedA family protein [Thermanaerothrix sp.]|nr:DedA family protein [Thermanaerothrix sp.]